MKCNFRLTAFLILAFIQASPVSFAKQENPYQVGTGNYELSRDQIDFLVQYINQSKTTLEDAVARASAQDLYTSFQTLLLATKNVILLSSSIKPRDELLLRVALNQALELTVGVPNPTSKGVVKKGVLASSMVLSSNIDLYNIILSDSINLALKYSEFDSKAVASGAFTELPYDKFSMERLAQFRQWSAFYMPEPTAYEFLRTGLTQWLSSMNPKYLLTKNAEYAESLVSAQTELNSPTLEKDVNRVRRLKGQITKILRNHKIAQIDNPISHGHNHGALEYSSDSMSVSNGYSYNKLIGGKGDKNSLAVKKAHLINNTTHYSTVPILDSFGKAGVFTNTNGAPVGLDLKGSITGGASPGMSSSNNFLFKYVQVSGNLALNLDLTKHFGTTDSINHFDTGAQLGFAEGTYFIEKDSKDIGFLSFKALNADVKYMNELVEPKNKTRFEIVSGGWQPELEFHTFFPLTQAVTGEFCFLTSPIGVKRTGVVGRVNDTRKFVNSDQVYTTTLTTEHSLCVGVNILGYAEIKDEVSSKFLIFLPDEKDERSFLMNITNELSVNRIGGPNSPFGAYYEYSQNRYMKDDLKNDEIKTIYTVNRHMFGIKLEY